MRQPFGRQTCHELRLAAEEAEKSATPGEVLPHPQGVGGDQRVVALGVVGFDQGPQAGRIGLDDGHFVAVGHGFDGRNKRRSLGMDALQFVGFRDEQRLAGLQVYAYADNHSSHERRSELRHVSHYFAEYSGFAAKTWIRSISLPFSVATFPPTT